MSYRRDTLRHAFRRIRRNPGFAAAAVGTLALAIAACITAFGAFEAVLAGPLPYGDPSNLALLWRRTPDEPGRRIRIAAPAADRIARQSTLIDGVAFVMSADDAILVDAARPPEHLRIGRVSGNLFDVLGVRAAHGRLFDAAAAAPAQSGLAGVVISHAFWRDRFGEDPGAIGRPVLIGDADFEIIGVMPESFEVMLPASAGMATDVDAWIALGPLAEMRRDDDRWMDQDSDNSGAVIARLRNAATFAQAQSELDAIGRNDATLTERAFVTITPMREDLTKSARPVLVAVLAAVLLVLLVACLNVTGLIVARAAGRRREIALRSALGASPARIVSHLLTEIAVITGFALAVGLVLALWQIDVVRSMAAAGIPGLDTLSLDASSFGFAVAALAVVTFVAAGLSAMSLPVRGDQTALRGRSPGRAAPAAVRRTLVVGQVAVSLALLSGAGLLLRSSAAVGRVRPGFDPNELVTFNLAMPGTSVGGPAQRSRLARDIADRIRELPAVRSVGFIGALPLAGEPFTQPWAAGNDEPDPQSDRTANFRVVSSDWFQASGTRILAGRSFSRGEDLAEDGRIAIIDQRLARLLQSDGDAIDGVIAFPLDGRIVRARIVGIAEDVHFESLISDARPTLYVPYRQEASRQIGFAVRTGEPTAALESSVRGILTAIGGNAPLPVWEFRPMRAFIRVQTAPGRFALFVTVAFAAVALLLTALSLYALVSWLVAEREAEIGVRIALGAAPSSIVARFASDGLMLGAIGAAFGFALALLLSRALAGLLYGTSRFDPVVLGSVTLLLIGIVALASFLPARRAGATDPIRALRSD